MATVPTDHRADDVDHEEGDDEDRHASSGLRLVRWRFTVLHALMIAYRRPSRRSDRVRTPHRHSAKHRRGGKRHFIGEQIFAKLRPNRPVGGYSVATTRRSERW